MAAAYSTGSATDQTDLLQKLVTFLVAQGWTSDSSVSDGSGWRAHLHKGSQYINMRAYTAAEATSSLWGVAVSTTNVNNGIGLYLGTGYSGASNWKSQAGRPISSSGSFTLGANLIIPSGTITAYHFFDDGSDNIDVVVEKAAGIYGAMGWGSLQKAGTVTGGDYFYGTVPSTVLGVTGSTDAAKVQAGTINGSAPCTYGSAYASVNGTLYAASYFRADVDTWTSKWIGTIEGTASSSFTTGWGGMSSGYGIGNPSANVPRVMNLQPRGANIANGRNVILPIHFYASRTAGGYSLVGRVPNVFLCGGTYSAASVVSIGGVNYMAFPCVTSVNGNGTLVSGSFLIRKMA